MNLLAKDQPQTSSGTCGWWCLPKLLVAFQQDHLPSLPAATCDGCTADIMVLCCKQAITTGYGLTQQRPSCAQLQFDCHMRPRLMALLRRCLQVTAGLNTHAWVLAVAKA